MAEGRSSWKFDLDAKEFLAKLREVQQALGETDRAGGLKGMTDKLMQATRLVGLVGAGAIALKTAFDAAFAYEKAEALNQQFEALARNAGLAGTQLKEKLVGATDGLVDDKEAIQAASEQIVRLGSNAAKLPEIMDLARRHTNAFGGDMIQKFDQLSTAIASGNARSLRSLGIIIDQEKAYKEYARSIGKTVDMLSQEERQRAMLDAVLKKGELSLKGINENISVATRGWQRLKVTLDNLKDQFMETFGRVAQPLVTRMIENMNVLATSVSKVLKDNFGTEAEKAEAELQGVYEKLRDIQAAIHKAEAARSEGGFWNKWLYGQLGGYDAEIARLEKVKQKLLETKAELQAKIPPAAAAAAEGGPAEAPTPPPPGDEDKIKAQKNRFQQDLLAMREQSLQQELAMSSAYIDQEGNLKYQGEALLNQKLQLLAEETSAKIQAIKENDALLESQKQLMLSELYNQEFNQRVQLENDLSRIKQQNLDRYVQQSSTAYEGVTRAFQAGAEQNRRALVDWGATGKMVFGSFQKQSTQALLAWGAGTMSAGEAVRNIMLGVVADTAEAKGQEMLLAGLWPPNPQAIAGGAGLIALAGFLRSRAGGAGGGIGGGGAGGAAPSAGTAPGSTAPEVQELPKKAVTIQIQGSYFETEQTQRRLVELIRQESDATDFSFRRIGG